MTQSEQFTSQNPQLNLTALDLTAQSPETPLEEASLSELQVQIWLRGLLTIAWADGDFDESEQQMVASITHHALTPKERAQLFTPLTADELKTTLGQDAVLSENFLRTAVMVAISDGVYTQVEDALLAQFCQALGTKTDILDALRSTLVSGDSGSGDVQALQPSDSMVSQVRSSSSIGATVPAIDPLQPVRVWLDGMEVQDPKARCVAIRQEDCAYSAYV
jgi:tellurite resistance protein